MFIFRRRSRYGFSSHKHFSEGGGCCEKLPQANGTPEPDLKGSDGSRKTILRGVARALGQWLWTSQTLTHGRFSLQPDGLVHGLFRCPRHNDRKRGMARSFGKGTRSTLSRPLTTEKMLSANRILSNIFLQSRQNIEFADKKCFSGFPNFGSRRGLAVY